MCDTIIATPAATASKVMIFGKNSDREPNEAQFFDHIPAADHAPGSHIQCTYIEIPQVRHTYATLLSRPFWLWGAEMGINEHLVTIGNEAVFTKEKVPEKGLLGMDLLRLGLERGATARAALDVIVALLEEFGQGGNGGYQHPLYYHNSFIIADPDEAWVLETSGKHWAALKVADVYSISNGLTLQGQWDLAAPDLVKHAVKQGWCSSAKDFDFARCYSDFVNTRGSFCGHRHQRTLTSLTAQQGVADIKQFAQTLRDHGIPKGEPFYPGSISLTSQVCMHHGFGPTRAHQTTGSLICYLDRSAPAFFVTGTAAPCTSLFKPIWLDTPCTDHEPTPSGVFNAETLFWRHERLHRATLSDYPNRIKIYAAERDLQEEQFIQMTLDQMRFGNPTERQAFARKCFATADQLEQEWYERLSASNHHPNQNILYRNARATIDKLSQVK
jgi:dipeptidase